MRVRVHYRFYVKIRGRDLRSKHDCCKARNKNLLCVLDISIASEDLRSSEKHRLQAFELPK